VHEYVGAWFEGGRFFCSGAAIHRRVVVTAKHCFDTEDSQSLGSIEFGLGRYGEIAVGHPTHLFYRGDLEVPGRAPMWFQDLVAVVLDADIPAPWATPRTEPMPTSYRRIVTMVGFGPTGQRAADVGVRRSGETLIEQVSAEFFETVGWTVARSGDSGGAVFHDGLLIGVISASHREGARGYAMRVDAFGPEIERAKAEAERRRDCACDTDKWCNDDGGTQCQCDFDCTVECPCDVGGSCDGAASGEGACACDRDCGEDGEAQFNAECECDTDYDCNGEQAGACACDPDCGGEDGPADAGCGCDADRDCNADEAGACACDPDCGSQDEPADASCGCDADYDCSEGCDCDPECWGP
jgi:hypothetical protein